MAKAQRTGVIRDYDMHSASVRVGYGFIIFFCLIMTVVAVFPIIWVALAGFKDLKEFMSSTKLLPEVFDFSLFAKTWSQLGIAQLGCLSLWNGQQAMPLRPAFSP